MKQLSEKFNKLKDQLNLSLEEISTYTKTYGGQIRFSSLRSLTYGTGGTNPSGTKLFALAQSLNVPIRFLADDNASTPIDAVLADVQLLSAADIKRLKKRLDE